MADPKYAGLPGIAHDQPDIFETNDLPESDQGIYLPEEEEAESIERLHISADQAYKSFKGKIIESGRVDFSDGLNKRHLSGYDARSGEWELACQGEKETPLQKLLRLKCETQELLGELEEIKMKKPEDLPDSVRLFSELETLQSQLVNLKVEQFLGAGLLESIDPKNSAHRQLIDQICSIKSASNESMLSESTSDHSKSSDNKLTYELYFRPEQAKYQKVGALAGLERRCDKLEKLVGCSSDKLTMLCAETNQKSLLGAVSTLTSKLSLLDPSQLDHIEGRLQSFAARLQQITDKSQALKAVEDHHKITEMYDLMRSSQAVATALPGIVDRLVALQSLHDQALQFNKSLVQFDCVQQQMSVSISDTAQSLQEVQKSLEENMGTIQANMRKIEDQINSLTKK